MVPKMFQTSYRLDLSVLSFEDYLAALTKGMLGVAVDGLHENLDVNGAEGSSVTDIPLEDPVGAYELPIGYVDTSWDNA